MEKLPCLKSDDNEDMTIKIQTLDNIFTLTIKRGSNIQEIKDKIAEITNIPLPKQRLIFQGKLLQNNEKAKNYKISDESVIHLVAKANDEMQENNTNNNNNNNSGNSTSNSNNANNPSILPEDIFSSLIEIPILRPRRPRRRRIPNFDLSECFESMHQNITSIQNLVNCRSKFDDHQIQQSKTITGFDFLKSKLEVGQWIDVKDTIDQWLEAQVIRVRGNQAYVHYNGWGTRWDEWIDFSSPRIAHFKTYTTQSPNSIFLSPYPSVVCDANIEPQHRSIDSFYYLEKSAGMMQEIIRNIENMSKLRKRNINKTLFDNKIDNSKTIRRDDFLNEESKYNETPNNNNNANSKPQGQANQPSFQLASHDYELLFLSSQMIPVMDRLGRLLSDISLHLSHLIINPNLYPQLLLGYNQNIDMSDTLSCASGFSMYTNEGSIISSITNPQQSQLNTELNLNLLNNIQLNRLQQTSQNISNNLNINSNLNRENILNNNTSNILINSANANTSSNANSNQNRFVTNVTRENPTNVQLNSTNTGNTINVANAFNSVLNNNSSSQFQTSANSSNKEKEKEKEKDKDSKSNKDKNSNVFFEKEKEKDKENENTSMPDDHSQTSETNLIISNEINYNIANVDNTSEQNNLNNLNSNNNNQNINSNQIQNTEQSQINVNNNNANANSNQNNNPNSGTQTNNNNNAINSSNNITNIFQNVYNINNTSIELPFVQRLYQSYNPNNNLNANNNQAYFDNFPKINLQVPSMLTPGEVILMNGYQNNDEPNIDIYVHTLVAPQSSRNSNNNLTANLIGVNNTNNNNSTQSTGISFSNSLGFDNNDSNNNNGGNGMNNENSINNNTSSNNQIPGGANRSITDYFQNRNSNPNTNLNSNNNTSNNNYILNNNNNNTSRNTSSNNLLNIQNNNPLNQLNNTNPTSTNNIVTITNRRNRFFANHGVSTSEYLSHNSSNNNTNNNNLQGQNNSQDNRYNSTTLTSDNPNLFQNNPFMSALNNRSHNTSLFNQQSRQGNTQFSSNTNINQANFNNTTLLDNLGSNGNNSNNENNSNTDNNTNSANHQIGGGSLINNLLGNLYSLINPQRHNRRGSTASDISSTSSTVLRNNLIGTNPINQNNLNSENTTLFNNGENRNNSNPNCQNCNSINIPSTIENNTANQNSNNNNIFSNPFFKEKGTQTDLALNSMLNKESHLKDNLMDCISNKSERNLSVKYKNTLSYKSVSEVSEFEEPYEEENTDYVLKNNCETKNQSNGKLNESLHSAVSNFSKDIFEEKDEEKHP